VNAIERKLADELLQASVEGDDAYMRKLIAIGVNANVQDDKGLKLIHYAAYHNFTEAVFLLLSQGADVNAIDSEDRTPLHLVAFNGNVEMAQLLLSRGANVNTKSFKHGNVTSNSALDLAATPLHFAARSGRTGIASP